MDASYRSAPLSVSIGRGNAVFSDVVPDLEDVGHSMWPARHADHLLRWCLGGTTGARLLLRGLSVPRFARPTVQAATNLVP